MIPSASPPASAMGTISPMPVIVTGWRTPGRLVATTGVPHMKASTCTSPNDSVLLIDATVTTSHRAKKSAICAGLSVPRKVRYGSYCLISGCSVVPDRLADHVLAVRAGKEDANVRELGQDVRDGVDQVVGALLVREASGEADHPLPLMPADPLTQRGHPLGRRVGDDDGRQDDPHFAAGAATRRRGDTAMASPADAPVSPSACLLVPGQVRPETRQERRVLGEIPRVRDDGVGQLARPARLSQNVSRSTILPYHTGGIWRSQ